MLTAIFDTETTGLVKNGGQPLAKQPHIIEFSGLLVEPDGKIVKELDFILDPGVTLDSIITKITGLTNADVKGKSKWSEKVDDVIDFFSQADRVVAHNLSFDRKMVDFEMERKFGDKVSEVKFWPADQVCTVEATEHLKGYRMSLTVLHEYLFNQPFEGAHRAMVDVKALTRCYVELVNRGVI